MNGLIEKIKELSKKPVFLKAAAVLGVLVIILILISDLSDGSGKKEKPADISVDFAYADAYTDALKAELSEMLASIEGVGKAQVMLTLSSAEEYVYAEEIKRGSSQAEKKYVIIDNGSQEEALVKKIKNPQVSGVLIVCEGGDDPRVCEKIYKAVSAALDVSTSKIYVAEMK